jgi:hypothetical protein
VDDENDGYLWDIYYHVSIDSGSLNTVRTQSRKLHVLSASRESWQNSKYGQLFRFCDDTTLARIREIWEFYCDTASSASWDEYLRRTMDMRARLHGVGPTFNRTGFRSAAPASALAVQDLPRLHQHFCDHGTTATGLEGRSEANLPNPMFASILADTSILHYATDPLQGFHLATAYIPLTSESPLHPEAPRYLSAHKAVETARLQFRVWGDSFKTCARQNLSLRFFAGEALAFCHTLQHNSLTRGGASANWYRGPSSLGVLVLDGEDYGKADTAPLAFNVIDTSNLMDHVGAINLLVATAPLLQRSPSATLYTESSVRRAKDQKAFIDGLLCGHFPTLSILLGLFPVEYWTNATATSADATIGEAMTQTNDEPNGGQMHSRLAWKQPMSTLLGIQSAASIQAIHFDEIELAQAIFQVYRKMFEHEDVASLLSSIDRLKMLKNSSLHYHRGSLASFLCFVKQRVITDWDKTMSTLLDLVERNCYIALGGNYLQELYVQLHLFGVYTAHRFRETFIRYSNSQSLRDLCPWNHIPEVVCITLRVPRPNLGFLRALSPADINTPPIHCSLCSVHSIEPWLHLFAVTQLAFGEITASEPRSGEDFVNIREDRLGWNGSCPMFVSFYVPSLVIALEGRDTKVSLALQPRLETVSTFLSILGVPLTVHETNLGNENDVFITKHGPNQSKYPGACIFAAPAHAELVTNVVRTTIAANLDLAGRIVTMTGRLNILSEDVKSALRSGAIVETIHESPCIIAVMIGKGPEQHHIHFPAPVLRSPIRTRIARKSSWIEVIAPICEPTNKERFPDFISPLFMHENRPVIWNMPRLSLDTLPILDTTKKDELWWLGAHTTFTLSTRERALPGKGTRPMNDPNADVRLNFKETLSALLMHTTGIHRRPSSLFALCNFAKSEINILLLVSRARLDLANHTVVLDAAVLPLTPHLLPRIGPFLAALAAAPPCQLRVDDKELRLWKRILPAMVERCRDWPHHDGCEYRVAARIPLSLEDGHTPICACGNGKLPPDFITGVPGWDVAAKYATRVAIGPCFAVPLVEDVGVAT